MFLCLYYTKELLLAAHWSGRILFSTAAGFGNAIGWDFEHILSSKCSAMVWPLLGGVLRAEPSENCGLF